MKERSLIALGAAAIATPVIAFLAFGGLAGHPKSKPAAAAAPSATPALSQLPKSSATATSALPTPAPVLGVVGQITPAQLESLAQAVKLSEHESEKIGTKKELWAKAIPVAERLLNEGSADCEQRNWLNQFIETGQEALQEAPTYYERARFLSTLYRNNQELATGIPSD